MARAALWLGGLALGYLGLREGGEAADKAATLAKWVVIGGAGYVVYRNARGWGIVK